MALIGLIFEVQKAESKPGEILRVTGASRCLGGWERREDRSLELRTVPRLYPSWKLLSPVWIPEDELQDGLLIEYKYVKDPGPWAEFGQAILWEDAIPNRRVWLPKEPGIWVVTDAAWNQEGPPSLRRLCHSELQARQEIASSPRVHPTPRALRSPSKLTARFDIEVVYAALGLEEESAGGDSTGSARRPSSARGQPGSARLSARHPVSARQLGSARQPASARQPVSARQPTFAQPVSARQPGSARLSAPGFFPTVSEASTSYGDLPSQSSADGNRSNPETFCLYRMNEAQDHETDTDTDGGDTDSDDYEAESPRRMLTVSERSTEELCACGSSARSAERTPQVDGASSVDPTREGAVPSMDEVMAENARLQREIAELRRQSDELRRENAKSQEERAALRRRNEELTILCCEPQAENEVEPEQTYLKMTLDFDSAGASPDKTVGPLRNTRREANPCSNRQQTVVPRLTLPSQPPRLAVEVTPETHRLSRDQRASGQR